MPGWNSSSRMSSAMSPPAKKKQKDITMYMIPSFLWSVVVSMSHAWKPLRDFPPWGAGRAVATGEPASSRGATAVIGLPPGARGGPGVPEKWNGDSSPQVSSDNAMVAGTPQVEG